MLPFLFHLWFVEHGFKVQDENMQKRMRKVLRFFIRETVEWFRSVPLWARCAQTQANFRGEQT